MDYKPKWRAEDQIDIISENKNFAAHDCHSYLIRNIGNTNATIAGILVLTPGEWFSSGEDNPDIVNETTFRIEFDRKSPITNAANYPGRDPNPENLPFDPTNPTAIKFDNRVLIVKKYLKPY